jgi:hypothetical protein
VTAVSTRLRRTAERPRRDRGSAAAPREEIQRAETRSDTANAMTIDVEDYFQVEAFASTIDRSDWERLPRRVEGNTDHLLEILGETGAQATFFVLGWVAERHPAWHGASLPRGTSWRAMDPRTFASTAYHLKVFAAMCAAASEYSRMPAGWQFAAIERRRFRAAAAPPGHTRYWQKRDSSTAPACTRENMTSTAFRARREPRSGQYQTCSKFR